MQQGSQPISPHYLGQLGEQYQQLRLSGVEFTRHYQADLYFRKHVGPEDTVLDFGCNDGMYLRWLNCRHRIGVEVNPAARAECERQSALTNIRVELHDDISDIPDSSVDVVISNHCLEHTLTPFEILRHLHRVLRPGGKLVVVLPYDDWRSAIHRRWKPQDPDNHLFTWSPLNIGNLMTEAGFEVERAVHTQYAFSPKLKPLHDRLGDRAFRLASSLLSRYRRRSETYAVATKAH